MPELTTSPASPSITCPACGGTNASDAIFCANPDCRKALGEFRYVQEEFSAESRWHETVAARVAAFVGHPLGEIKRMLHGIERRLDERAPT